MEPQRSESARYWDYKNFCQWYCRLPVLRRDNHRCQLCGETWDLQLAHITPANDFADRKGGKLEDIFDSYTMDNLVILCCQCHQSGLDRLPLSGAPLFLSEEQLQRVSMEQSKIVAKARRESEQRRQKAYELQQRVFAKRGWKTVEDFYALEQRPKPLVTAVDFERYNKDFLQGMSPPDDFVILSLNPLKIIKIIRK